MKRKILVCVFQINLWLVDRFIAFNKWLLTKM